MIYILVLEIIIINCVYFWQSFIKQLSFWQVQCLAQEHCVQIELETKYVITQVPGKGLKIYKVNNETEWR